MSPHMSSQYGELRPTSGWDLLASLGHPSIFERVSRLGTALLHGTLVVGVSQTAVLNRGCHLYPAGRPSRWALAHVSSYLSTLPENALTATKQILNITYFVYFLAFNGGRRRRYINTLRDNTGNTRTLTWQQYSCLACRLLTRPCTVRFNKAAFNKLIVKFLPLYWSCRQTPAVLW